MSLSYFIIIITCLTSVYGFIQPGLIGRLIFYPPAITFQRQWYRFFSCGFIHGDVMHLAFNMISFYFFSGVVEESFRYLFKASAVPLYLIFYVSAIGVSILPSYLKHKADRYYSSLGASGAVSAVVFCGIFLFPKIPLNIMFLPFEIPGYIFGVVYLTASYFLDKKDSTQINHSAHLWGGLYGIFFIIIFSFLFTKFNAIASFWYQLF